MERAGAWPLAGRVDELRTIAAALAGDGGGLVLVGEAGVGKTRLLREALLRWAERGGEYEWLVATRGTASIPFGAVSHLLPAGFTPNGNGLALMGLTMLGKVADALAARSERGRLVVGVDDAHFLDESSAALLHQLATRGLIVPLASVRTGEYVSDSICVLWKDAGRLPVRPLPAAAVDEILDQALDGQIDPISRARLRRLAAGNPLLLRELMADARETGALDRREGIWRWRGTVPGTARLAELVNSRLAALSPDVLGVLEAIACGEPLALETLSRLADADAIERAERSGMAVADRSGNRIALRLAHPLYGEALRAHLPASRARAIWAQLAEIVAAGPMRRRDDALVAGVWELQSGTIQHPAVLLAAARQAVARFDLDLAERLVRGARGAGDALPGNGRGNGRGTDPSRGDGPVGWEADLLLAQILTYQARYEDAIQVLPESPPAGGEQLAMWAVTRAGILYWGLDQTEEAERTLNVTAPAGPEQDMLRAVLTWILLFDGRCESALKVTEEILDQPDASDRAIIWSAMGGAAAAGLLGRIERAVEIGERGRAVADRYADHLPWAQAQVGYGICHAWHAAGELYRAQEVADEGQRIAVAHDAGSMAGMWAGLRGIIAKAQGRLGDAELALREAVVLLEDNDEYQCIRPCLAELAGAAALVGDAAGAAAWLARADGRKRSANRVYDAWVERNRAWVEAASGATSAAIAILLHAAELARDTEQPAYEALIRYDIARLGAAGSVRDRLHALARHIEGPFIRVLAGAVTALAEANAEGLEVAAAGLAGHGHLLHAAEVTAAAARAYRRNGQLIRMRAAIERTVTLTASCQGARTPLLDLAGLGTALSRREREVATLASTLTSRQVADRLGLSVHTVNNTLARAYAKLGVRNRSELAAALGTLTPTV